MEQAFAVYKTDNWHSYGSRDLIALTDSHAMAVILIRNQCKKEHQSLHPDQTFNLNNINQTQGYSGEGEFVIEQLPVNVLF